MTRETDYRSFDPSDFWGRYYTRFDRPKKVSEQRMAAIPARPAAPAAADVPITVVRRRGGSSSPDPA